MFTDYQKQRLKNNKELGRKVEELKVLEGLLMETRETKKVKNKMRLDLEMAQQGLADDFNNKLTELELRHISVMIDYLRQETNTVSITK